jgi:hypothetical protein
VFVDAHVRISRGENLVRGVNHRTEGCNSATLAIHVIDIFSNGEYATLAFL